MSLFKQINTIAESVENDHDFVVHNWRMKGSKLPPVDVRVKYTAKNNIVNIQSLTTNAVMKHGNDQALDIEHFKKIQRLHAIVTGHLNDVKREFPLASVLDGNAEEFETLSHQDALRLFNFVEDHKSGDIIINVGSSKILKDIDTVTVLKDLLDDCEMTWKTVHMERSFTFTGRLLIGVASGTKVHDSIKHRTVKINKEDVKTYPRGTHLQDLPDWHEDNMAFFEKKAAQDYKG